MEAIQEGNCFSQCSVFFYIASIFGSLEMILLADAWFLEIVKHVQVLEIFFTNVQVLDGFNRGGSAHDAGCFQTGRG